MTYTVKDSGNRREFGTGAVRDMGDGKGRTDLLPFHALLEVSKHMEAGAVKYGDENWRKGIPLRTYLDSAIRHLFKFALGMRDERHDLAAAWNVLCLIETQHMIDRGILTPTLGNLPDWFDPHPEPAGPTLAGLYSSTFSEGAVVSDFIPVEELDDYLTARFPQPGPIQRANQAQRDALAELRPDPNPNLTIDLRPQDYEFPDRPAAPTPALLERAYTRGHADDTAARFNAGLPYADDLRADELPQAQDIQAAVDADAALAIAGHPLFEVVIINGPDAATYDGPEVCGIKPDTCGCYGSPAVDPNPLDGVPFAILRVPDEKDTRRWLVEDQRVFYSADPSQEPYRASILRDIHTVRSMVLTGAMVIDQIGRGG